MIASSDQTEQFRAAILAAGLTPPDEIQDGGELHRFSTGNRRGDKSGWYVMHTDGIAAGTFGCWRAGLHSTWCSKADSAMTAAERDAHRQRIKDMRAQREAAESARQQDEADKASDRWHSASTPCRHLPPRQNSCRPDRTKNLGA
ncbi:MAG: DNA primase, partial [Hydrogenophaga sp.]|nr:DNA primase [Hydrogenophaga sp.]